MALRDKGRIRMLKLGLSEHDYALVEEERYSSYLQAFLQEDPALCRKVTESVLPRCREVSVSHQQLVGGMAVSETQLR